LFTVEALVYWRDPISSGIVFGATLVVLLSFAYMSLISVVAYLAMFIQSGCILLRLYKTALQTVNKTNESHPFQLVEKFIMIVIVLYLFVCTL